MSEDDRPTKNQRRAEAREKARRLREQQKKRERRNRVLWQGGIGVGILVVLGIVALVIVTSIRPAAPGPKNMISDGILIGKDFKAVRTPAIKANGTPSPADAPRKSGTVRIVTYVDYLCPFCGQFERTNDAYIGKLVESGAATIEIHPLPLLENSSLGTKYSLRAANTAACVANYDPDHYWKLNLLLFENQPEENSAGLTDEQLKGYVEQAGVTKLDEVEKCMDSGRFNDWAHDALARWRDNPIPNSDFGDNPQDSKGTPIVVVNGLTYRGGLTDADAFKAFLLSAQSAHNEGGNETPAPSTTPEPRSPATPTP